MTTESGVQREPTAFDAVLGVATLLIGLVDVIWLSLLVGGMLSGSWDDPMQPAAVVSLVGLVLALGLAGSAGIILRSMGYIGGPASPVVPLLAIGLRIVLLALPITIVVLESGTWTEKVGLDSVFILSRYLVPTTLLLLVLALVNLKPRNSAG